MKELTIWKVSQSPNLFTEQENEDLYKRNCVCVHPNTSAKGTSYTTQGDDFRNVKKGDFFYLCYGNKRIRLFGRFTGESKKSKLSDKSDWLEQKYVLYFESNSNEIYQGTKAWWTPSDNSTFIKCKNNEDFQNWILIPFFSKTLNDIVAMETVQDYVSLLTKNHNLILTGAPGTGKTYLAKEIAEQIVSQKKTLRPIEVLESAINKYEHNGSDEKNLLDSFQYRFPKEKLKEMTLDDYCIGKQNKDNFCYWIERKLKPLGSYFPGSSNTYLLYWNKELSDYKVTGYLKKLGQEPEALIKVLANDLHKMVNDNDPEPYSEKFGKSFILKVLNSYYPNEYVPINSKEHIDNIISLFGIDCNSNNIFERNKAIYNFYKEHCKDKDISPFDFMHILYENFNINDGEVIGEGGEIKTNGDYKLVQFHPSYDYTDFVEGLRPKRDDNGNVSFERKDGVFKVLCSTALRNPNKKYVIIIDEINRGETSKIFGELFFSIDPGYRGKDGKVKTQYANMQEEPNDFDDALGIKESDNCGWFFVPENVYIIGTMNDIDRSVESMDFAFRRRFAFKEIKAIDRVEMLYDAETGIGEYAEKAKNRMIHLNEEIEKIEGLSSAYHVGPAYFLKLKNYNGDFNQLWEYHLDGLLREYLRGMQNVDDSMGKLKTAYENENPTDGQ